jgi:hypothetical protein
MPDLTIERGEGVASDQPSSRATRRHEVYIRRREASAYLLATYGFGAYQTLSKGAVTGDSPEYSKAGRIVLYTREALDAWATGKIGAPRKSSSAAVAA